MLIGLEALLIRVSQGEPLDWRLLVPCPQPFNSAPDPVASSSQAPELHPRHKPAGRAVLHQNIVRHLRLYDASTVSVEFRKCETPGSVRREVSGQAYPEGIAAR
jgi:hypothetical protein